MTRNRTAWYLAAVVALSPELGLNWHIAKLALKSENPRRSTANVPPSAFRSAESALDNRCKSAALDFSCAAGGSAGLTRLSHSAGRECCSHQNTSSGNRASSRSYPASLGEYSQPCAARCAQISSSSTDS